MITPTTSRSNRRSSGPRPLNASSISDSVYDDELNRCGGPSPAPNQWARTFSIRANSTRCAPDRCMSLSLRHRRTTCGVTSNLFDTAATDRPAVNIESLTREPKVDNFSFPLRASIPNFRPSLQGGDSFVSRKKSSLPRSGAVYPVLIAESFIRSCHAGYFCLVELLNTTQLDCEVLR